MSSFSVSAQEIGRCLGRIGFAVPQHCSEQSSELKVANVRQVLARYGSMKLKSIAHQFKGV